MKLSKNVIVGGFLLVMLAILTFASVQLGQIGVGGQDWTVLFGREAMVEEGYEVFVSGTKQGVVRKVELLAEDRIDPAKDEYVKVTISIPKDLVLWEGSELNIVSRGVFGGLRAELYRGTPGAERLTPNTTLRGHMDGGIMEQFTGTLRENRADLRQIIRNIEQVTHRLNEGEGSFGRFLKDERVYNNINRVLDGIALLVERANADDGSLAKLLSDQELYSDIKNFVSKVSSISTKIDAGKGTLGRLVNDATIMAELEDTAKKVRLIVEDIQSGGGAVGLLLKDPQTRDDIELGVRALRRLAQKLDEGDGSIAMLLNDKRVYTDLQTTVSIMRNLFEGVQEGKGTLGLFLKDESVYRELRGMLEGFRESGDVVRENAVLGTLVSFSNLFFNVLN